MKQIHIQATDEQYWAWKKKSVELKLSMADFIVAKVEGEC